jgi:HSP20 family molecular chaperone IbpA
MINCMKKFSLLFTLLSTIALTTHGEEIQRNLRPFTKIVASPKVNVVLVKGDHESIRLEYSGVSKDYINIDVRGKTLHIYLDYAKKVERNVRNLSRSHNWEGMYKGARLTAYVTYKSLKLLEMRGNQDLTCKDAIEADRFVLRAYGENQISLASLKTEYFKASLYGENDLKIKSGKVLEQKYRLFGENKIDTREMRSEYTSTSIFGVGNLKINTSEEIRVNAFGEPKIYVDGGGHINRRLIFGRAQIVRR